MANEDLSRLKIEKSESTYSPLRRRKLGYMVGAIFFILLMGFLYVKGVLTPAVEVEVASVTQLYPSQTFTLLNASGYVVAQRKAAVASKVTGRLVSLSVEEGSKVKAGQVIARFENDDVKAARDQSEANLNAARHNLEQAKAELNDAAISFNRNKDLVSQGFISKAEHDTSEARYKKAVAAAAADEAAIKASVAALQSANVALEYTLIRAPFDAVVLTKNADIGDIVTPIGAAANAKAAVVTIADMDSLLVEADVSESNLQQVKIGQPCEIQLDALPDSRFRGTVHMIVPTADRTKATVMIKVRFVDQDRRILPEMSAKVAFLSREVRSDEQKPRTALNPDAIRDRNGKKTVFLIKENRVMETPVTLGKKFGDMVEVLSGVKAGDRVVLKPLNKMREGLRIKVAEK
ncbi:MAG: efflux transporter periplasmic adaptor subunit [Thermodesulfovibrio sp. RBG_19FT_COMBO_41_18]|jgi:RND family efflux transporter MFP subunit|nr:MAG: efflux transporter periplasmic adaptor subunit [Thermodesulfovibrio sp. RBG_19FT_COMBO_41_18]